MNQEKNPLVSVVMPTYNHASYIGQAVESVLGQTYENLELIVVDNFSSDGTEGLIAGVKDPRVKYLKFANKGVIAASRNRGMAEAAGRYVAFLDSDDVWLPGKLAAQVAALRAAPGAVMCYSRFRNLEEGKSSGEALPPARLCASGRLFRTIYLKKFIACSGVLAEKAVVDELKGFDEDPELFAVEDTDLWLRLALAGDIVCAGEEPLLLYRVHPGAQSRGMFRKYRRSLSLGLKHLDNAGVALFALAAVLYAGSVLRQKAAELFRR